MMENENKIFTNTLNFPKIKFANHSALSQERDQINNIRFAFVFRNSIL